jgi:hypothetical protein
MFAYTYTELCLKFQRYFNQKMRKVDSAYHQTATPRYTIREASTPCCKWYGEHQVQAIYTTRRASSLYTKAFVIHELDAIIRKV